MLVLGWDGMGWDRMGGRTGEHTNPLIRLSNQFLFSQSWRRGELSALLWLWLLGVLDRGAQAQECWRSAIGNSWPGLRLECPC